MITYKTTLIMRTTLLSGLIALCFFAPGCEPDDDPTPQTQDFTCIKMFDENGQGLGLHGSCTASNDWGAISLSATEQGYLNFSDTVGLTGTVATPFSEIGIAPNPVKIDESFHVYVIGSSPNPSYKLKVAIVDESLNMIQQIAIRSQTSSAFALYIDPAKFEAGKYYRMYYRVSAEGAPSLLEGYGNFLVCKTFINGVNTTIESDCL